MFEGNLTNGILQRVGQDSHVSVLTSIILSLIILVAAIISVVGNVFTCLIVYRKRPMRSAINLLLTNIAFADIVLAVIVMPYVVCEMLNVETTIPAVCVSISVLKDASMCATAYTLLVISLDRYLIIVHRKDKLSPKVAKIAILAIWCGSLILTAPQLLGFLKKDLRTYDRLTCNMEEESVYSNYKSAYVLLLLSLIFYGPVAIMCYTYAAILRAVQQTSKRVHDHSGSSVSVSVTQYSSKLGLPPVAVPYRFTGDFSAKRKAFGTILMLFVTLLCCWLPYTTNRIVNSKLMNFQVNFSMIALGFVKSALYPVIFSVRNKKFRIACMRYIPISGLISKLSRAVFHKTRINPNTLYQCSEHETRI